MSRKGVKASGAGPEEDQKTEVLDFLYNDARRVGSFLSQFDQAGHLQRVVQKEEASKESRAGFAVGVSGGATVLGTGGQGGLNFQRTPHERGSEGLDREYDPLWANALSLLDFLGDRGLLKTDLKSARIGQFVKFSGNLRIHDMGTLKLMWDIPSVRAQIGSGIQSNGNRKERRASGVAKSESLHGLEIGIEILKTLPHGVIARMSSDEYAVWSSLQADFVTGRTSDLFLKHGADIAGSWTMVGMLDAEPEQILPTNYDEAGNALGFIVNGFGHVLDILGPLARMFLGRPSGMYGVTPLLIYRVVQG